MMSLYLHDGSPVAVLAVVNRFAHGAAGAIAAGKPVAPGIVLTMRGAVDTGGIAGVAGLAASASAELGTVVLGGADATGAGVA